MVAPVEISAAVTSVQTAFNIAKTMVGLRDAEVFRAKSFELQAAMLDAIEKAIAAREAQSSQLDRIRALGQFGSTYECGICHGKVVVSVQRVPRWKEG